MAELPRPPVDPAVVAATEALGMYPGDVRAPNYAPCGPYNYGCGVAAGGCGGYGAPGYGGRGEEVPRVGCGGRAPPNEFAYAGWTEVGYVYNTEAYPLTEYLSKSCQRCDADPFLRCRYSECTGCRSEGLALDKAYDDKQAKPYTDGEAYATGDLALPSYRRDHLDQKFHHQRRTSAFERKTMASNYGIGYGVFGAPRCGLRANSLLGWHYGTLHATGCRCNRCSQDVMLHPRTTVTTPVTSRYYRLFARRVGQCEVNAPPSHRLEFAVAAAGVVDPQLIVLPADPRQPSNRYGCYYASNCGPDYVNRSIVELVSGDQIYIAGERGLFNVHLWADDDIYRQNHSVFRGWGPVRRLRGKHATYNSGTRNFTAAPSANGLLRPF